MTFLPSSNTDSIRKTDRSMGGNQPDKASSTGGSPTGLSVTVVTAKLTSGGAQGSMTFSSGILVSQVAAS